MSWIKKFRREMIRDKIFNEIREQKSFLEKPKKAQVAEVKAAARAFLKHRREDGQEEGEEVQEVDEESKE